MIYLIYFNQNDSYEKFRKCGHFGTLIYIIILMYVLQEETQLPQNNVKVLKIDHIWFMVVHVYPKMHTSHQRGWFEHFCSVIRGLTSLSYCEVSGIQKPRVRIFMRFEMILQGICFRRIWFLKVLVPFHSSNQPVVKLLNQCRYRS